MTYGASTWSPFSRFYRKGLPQRKSDGILHSLRPDSGGSLTGTRKASVKAGKKNVGEGREWIALGRVGERQVSSGRTDGLGSNPPPLRQKMKDESTILAKSQKRHQSPNSENTQRFGMKQYKGIRVSSGAKE